MKRLVTLAFVVIAFLAVPINVTAWGPEGHQIVAALAQARLSDAAKNGIHSLIGDASLASVANWADQIRSQRDETYNWHFVDIPKSAPIFSEPRDCFLPDNKHAGAPTDHQNCVVDRIRMFEQILADVNASQTARLEALKFVIHFVGDVHQPFHAIGDSAGGNGIAISEFGSTTCGNRPCNLHSAWDSGLIRHTGMGVDEYVQHLEQLISNEHLTSGGTPEDWANESHRYAQSAWLDNGGQVDEAYFEQQIRIIDTRLALAGLRLAATLNTAFEQTSGSAVTTETYPMVKPLNSTLTPADTVSPSWDKPEPHESTFVGPDGSCPWDGDQSDPDTFARKNRDDVPNMYHDVQWAAIHDLPFPTDKPLRVHWTEEHLREIAEYEGVAVRTVGYIVAIKPQNGHGEGTNCGFTLASETDTHIALVGDPTDVEKDSVVVEFTPRFLKLHPNWNKTVLSEHVQNTQIRISGWLMFDPDHRNHLNRYRHTLWEIHPITKIEVFEDGQWKDVDDF